MPAYTDVQRFGKGELIKVKGLIWLGVKTPQFDAMTTLYRDVMDLEVFQADKASSRFRIENGTEVHVYGPEDEDHNFFGPGPVVGFLVDDVAGARAYQKQHFSPWPKYPKFSARKSAAQHPAPFALLR